MSYQLLFIFGLAFGTEAIPIDGLTPAREWIVVVPSVVIAVFLFVLRLTYALNLTIVSFVEKYHRWLDVVQLGPVRLLNFAAFGVVLYWLARQRRWWSEGSNPLVRCFAFLGQHSLPVFAWSILTTYIAMSVLPYDTLRSVRALALVLAVSSLMLPAFLHAKLRHHLKKRGGAIHGRPSVVTSGSRSRWSEECAKDGEAVASGSWEATG
jgi:hypothetical protein